MQGLRRGGIGGLVPPRLSQACSGRGALWASPSRALLTYCQVTNFPQPWDVLLTLQLEQISLGSFIQP